MIGGQRVDWQPHAVMVTPPGDVHSHHNDGARVDELPDRPGRRAALPLPHHGLRLRRRLSARPGGPGMPYATDRRRRAALLRGGGRGRAGRVRPRVRGRPPQLGGAAALLQPAPPLPRLRGARLSALGRAGRSRRATARRAPRPTSSRSWTAPGSSARTSSACRWARSRRCTCGLDHPERALSLVLRRHRLRRREAAARRAFRAKAEAGRQRLREPGQPGASPRSMAAAPRASSSQAKDPRGWREMVDWLGEHDPLGAANTMRGVQAQRPSLYDLEDPPARGSRCRR